MVHCRGEKRLPPPLFGWAPPVGSISAQFDFLANGLVFGGEGQPLIPYQSIVN